MYLFTYQSMSLFMKKLIKDTMLLEQKTHIEKNGNDEFGFTKLKEIEIITPDQCEFVRKQFDHWCSTCSLPTLTNAGTADPAFVDLEKHYAEFRRNLSRSPEKTLRSRRLHWMDQDDYRKAGDVWCTTGVTKKLLIKVRVHKVLVLSVAFHRSNKFYNAWNLKNLRLHFAIRWQHSGAN